MLVWFKTLVKNVIFSISKKNHVEIFLRVAHRLQFWLESKSVIRWQNTKIIIFYQFLSENSEWEIVFGRSWLPWKPARERTERANTAIDCEQPWCRQTDIRMWSTLYRLREEHSSNQHHGCFPLSSSCSAVLSFHPPTTSTIKLPPPLSFTTPWYSFSFRMTATSNDISLLTVQDIYCLPPGCRFIQTARTPGRG